MKKDLPVLEAIVYYLTCVLTMGGSWVMKIIIKKAIMEAKNGK